MILKENLTKIGKFQKTHALKGELNALLDIDPDYFLDGNPLIIETDGILVPFYVDTLRNKGSFSYLIKLEDIDSEETARSFVNKEIFIPSEIAKELIGNNEDDWENLVDFKIIDANSHQEIGTVRYIDDSTTNILLAVEDTNEAEIFIPLAEEFIVSIDDMGKTITMNLPEGLIGLNKKE